MTLTKLMFSSQSLSLLWKQSAEAGNCHRNPRPWIGCHIYVCHRHRHLYIVIVRVIVIRICIIIYAMHSHCFCHCRRHCHNCHILSRICYCHCHHYHHQIDISGKSIVPNPQSRTDYKNLQPIEFFHLCKLKCKYNALPLHLMHKFAAELCIAKNSQSGLISPPLGRAVELVAPVMMKSAARLFCPIFVT